MNLPDGLLADEWTVALAAVHPDPTAVVATGAVAAPRGPPGATSGSNLIVGLMLLWSVQGRRAPRPFLCPPRCLRIRPSPAVRGWPFSTSAPCLPVSFSGDTGWHGYALNALLMGGVGVSVAYALQRFVELPAAAALRLIFANGFFGGALAISAVGAASSCCSPRPASVIDYVLEEYHPMCSLLSFFGAWLSGMVVTLFVVCRPAWVSSFRMPVTYLIKACRCRVPFDLAAGS